MSGECLIILLRDLFSNLKVSGDLGNLELEVRFGTLKGQTPISKEQHDSVIRKALSGGFSISEPSKYLRVSRETGARLEISGDAGITSYCRNDDPAAVIATKQAQLVEKQRIGQSYDVSQYGFRVALSREEIIHDKAALDDWDQSKKFFRLIERVSLTKGDLPFRIDVSVTKQSEAETRTFAEARLYTSIPRYEIEIEIITERVGVGTDFASPEDINLPLKSTIGMVLAGLQGSNFPLTLDKQNQIKAEYCKLIRPIETKCVFVGPSSISLQIDNIARVNENSRIPNIREGYTVTDKADGTRKLMFIDSSGHINLIDTNLRVQFTGAVTENKDCFNSLIDGEHIENGRNGSFINLFAAFDIYFAKGKVVCNLPFVNGKEGRLAILGSHVGAIRPRAVAGGSTIRCETKVFHQVGETNLFAASDFVLDRGASLEYDTDGLIFTPSNLPVGAAEPGDKPVLTRTWVRSFKWKPPKFNTVDFMVSVVKNASNIDVVKNKFQRGTNTASALAGTSYKTLVLKVGFDDAKHGYLDPCGQMREGSRERRSGKGRYRPVQFFPTNPSDSKAGMTNVEVNMSPAGVGPMLCEEGGVIEDNTIVEFRYDFAAEEGWRWKPLRVRYDKTAKLRTGKPSYGNAYHVANSNWHSIHNPVTENMIRTGEGIGEELATDNIYYTALSTKSYTKSLRDFHNLWVKKRLIVGASRSNGTLIDLACGRGGDLPKWIAAGLRFVYGIDLVDDNISNRLDGACARYLNYSKRTKRMPKAIFSVGDATLNIRDGTGISAGIDQAANMAVFGMRTEGKLPQGIRSAFGIGKSGFDVCSLQFAIHYMFKNSRTFNNCLRNIAEVTKVGGYFIGTCYDGAKVFNALRSKPQGGSVSKSINEQVIWALTKLYATEAFRPDIESLGLAIDVYQETIGKTFREYLVNLTFLEEQLEAYGFTTLSPGELKEVNLPTSVGSFRLLYDEMMGVPKSQKYGQARELSGAQMDISFLNSYFIFKKTREVDAELIAKTKMGIMTDANEKEERCAVENAIHEANETAARNRYRFARTGRKITLGKN